MTELYRSRLVTSTRQALCALTLVSGLMAAPSEAQVLYGSITGAVRDPSEAAIQGAGDARYSGYPHFATGLSALGNSTGSQPAFSDEGTFSLATNVTKVMGRHDLRAGYLGNFLYLSFWQPEQSNPRGVFTFAGNATALRGTGAQTANFYNTYAAFLMGLVGTAAKSVQYEEMTTREWQHGLFIRDRFQVSPKLTLDLGLRWEYYPIMHRADRGLEAAKDNFAPRLGLIYRINDNTVARGGYGVTYNSGRGGVRCAASIRPPARRASSRTSRSAGSARSTRHPAHHRSGPAERQVPAATGGRHPNARTGQRRPRHDPVL